MATSQELADIIFNRQAVALARSRRLVQSWLPPKPTTDDAELPDQQPAAEEEDDDWEGMTELQGVGSKRKAEDEGVLDGLKRKKLSSDNKLLELLLGKKAAQAKKKTLETSRYGGRAVATPLEKRATAVRQHVSEDEEEGRASSFKSRKSKAKPAVVELEPEVDRPEDPVPDEDGMGAKQQVQALSARVEAHPPAKKRKGGSYLDEILNQKAAKQDKKKKEQHKLDKAEA